MTSTKAICLAVLCAVFVSIATVFQKLAGEKLPAIITNWPILAAILFYFIGLLFLIKAFKHNNLTAIYPIVASSYILSAVYAMILFKETISLLRWFGVIFVFLGVAMIGADKK